MSENIITSLSDKLRAWGRGFGVRGWTVVGAGPGPGSEPEPGRSRARGRAGAGPGPSPEPGRDRARAGVGGMLAGPGRACLCYFCFTIVLFVLFCFGFCYHGLELPKSDQPPKVTNPMFEIQCLNIECYILEKINKYKHIYIYKLSIGIMYRPGPGPAPAWPRPGWEGGWGLFN